MKKILSVLAALVIVGGSVTAFGATQAGIKLNNYDSNNGNGSPIFYLTSGTLAGPGCFVQVLGGADANSMTPVTVGTTSVFELTSDGSFDAGIGIVSGVTAGASASFQVLTWKGGSSYAAALESAKSDVFTGVTGTIADPPAAPQPATFAFPAGLVIQPIPEPTTLALGLIGAAGLLFFRRK